MKSNHLVTLNPITDKTNLIRTIVHGFFWNVPTMPFFLELKRCHLQQEHFVSMRKLNGPKTDHFSNTKVFGVKGFAFE